MAKTISPNWSAVNPLQFGPGQQIVELTLDDLFPRNHRTWSRSGCVGQVVVFEPFKVTQQKEQTPGFYWVLTPHSTRQDNNRVATFYAFLERTELTLHFIRLDTYATITQTVSNATVTPLQVTVDVSLVPGVTYALWVEDDSTSGQGRLFYGGVREQVKTQIDLP